MGSADIISTLPELVLIATALVLLIMESAAEPHRELLATIALGGLAIALVTALGYGSDGLYYSGMLQVDSYARFVSALSLILAALAITVAVPYLRRTLEERGEYYSLMLFATVGMLLMVKAQDLTMVFLGLELLSIPLYVLAGFYRSRTSSNEAGLKYLLLGAFAAGFFLFGIALLYGSTGTTSYSGMAQALQSGNELSRVLTLAGFGLLLVGFAFKVALVPFHMYAPDVYEGAPTSMSAFLSTGPKLAGFATLLKMIAVVFAGTMAQWWSAIWILAALTMTVGNLAALRQDSLKRMLAYSSVAHAGYLALAVLVANDDSGVGMLFYLTVYVLTTLAAFGIVSLLEEDEESAMPGVEACRGLARRNPWLAASFTLALLTLAGFPPTAGFLGKFFVFNAALDAGYIGLVILAVLNSLVSVYYYLRPVVAMYMQTGKNTAALPIPRMLMPALLALAVVSLGVGLIPAQLVHATAAAISAIL